MSSRKGRKPTKTEVAMHLKDMGWKAEWLQDLYLAVSDYPSSQQPEARLFIAMELAILHREKAKWTALKQKLAEHHWLGLLEYTRNHRYKSLTRTQTYEPVC